MSTSPIKSCAACKHQRRRCRGPHCSVAPFFPADRAEEFQKVLRLFSLRKLDKMICHTDPHLKSDLVRSIIYEANARVQDPVGGCHRIMLRLNHQLRQEQSKLAQVLEQLRIRRREVSNMYNNHQTMMNNQFQEQKPYQDIGQQRICRSQVRNICNDRHPRMNNQSQEQQQHQDIVEAESSRSPVSSNTTNPHPMMNNHIQEQQQYNDIIQEESVGACEAKEPPVRVISDKEQMVPVDSTDATLMLLSGGFGLGEDE